MGDKATKAILAAGNAITAMNTAADAVQQDFVKLVAQEANHEGLLKDLVGRCNAVYPGVQDIGPLIATDPELKRMVTTRAKSEDTLTKVKVGLKASVLLLDQNLTKARAALKAIDELISAKKQKQSAAGHNPIKLVKAKLGTKSLGDLKQEKKKIDQTIRDVVDRTLAIDQYAKKVL